MKKKLDSFYLEYMGWIKTKTISRYCPFKYVQVTEEASSSQKRPSNTSKHKFFLLLWVIFALLDPDPDSEYGSGSTGPIEYRSNTNPDPDPKPCRFRYRNLFGSVADLDPEHDPCVFGPSGSGSGSIGVLVEGMGPAPATDLAPDPSIFKHNNKKNRNSFSFVTFMTFSL